MHKFFETAILMTLVITFINGGLFVFGGLFMDEDFSSLPDTRTTAADVEILADTSQNTAKESEPASQILDFVGGLVGTISNVSGGMGVVLNSLFSFGDSYNVMFKLLFGGVDILYCDQTCVDNGGSLGFLQLTIIPLISLMQVLSITYILIYAINALRGGGA